MQPTYFASFLLGEDSETPPPPIADAIEVIAQWIFNNPYRQLAKPPQWPDNIADLIRFPNGESVQLLRLQNGEGLTRAAAVRFEHSDEQSRYWRTDCVLTTLAEPETAVRFAVTVAAGSSGASVSPVNPPRTRPRIVRAMMDRFGARERFPLKPTFLRISADEAERFVDFLLDPERNVPVVLISRRNRDAEWACDPADLSDKLVGIAYVCVANDTQLSWALARYIDNSLNTYDGAVRVYWPHMKPDDSPYRHRLWTQQRLFAMEGAQRSLADELLGLVAAASVTRRMPSLVRWEDIEREITKQTIQRLQVSGSPSAAAASEDWLRQYELDLAALDAARQELASLSERLLEKEEEVRQWKQLYLRSQRSKPSVAAEAGDDDALVEDSASAIETAARDFKERLEFMDGRIQREAQQFEEPELLYAAFRWLVTIYWNAKTGVERCADLDKSCRETCQFRFTAHQSEITMGMFASDYKVSYRGSKISLKEHIGFGTSTEPRHSIRIAFFFDEASGKVIIGYVGQHQATRKSN